jgi:hypothetical protein
MASVVSILVPSSLRRNSMNVISKKAYVWIKKGEGLERGP